MIVCWFSCGAASACATKLAIEKYGRENIRVVNNPVINEHPDNKRFLAYCEKWLDKMLGHNGNKITIITRILMRLLWVIRWKKNNGKNGLIQHQRTKVIN